MAEADPDRHIIDLVAEEVADRLRRGERPLLAEYLDRYPEAADELREVFPTLLLMERLGFPDDAGEAEHAAPAADEPIPKAVGEFTIVREIGRGGMGIVYEAEQRSLGRRVALKVLAFRGRFDEKQIRRFQIEARAAARLQHPGIVPVYEVGEENGVHYYAMQHIAGHGLDMVIERLRALRSRESASTSVEPGVDAAARWLHSRAGDSSSSANRDYFLNVARIGAQVAEALACAHEQGIVHRDIKPSNLLIDVEGQVWVTDFGLAKTQDSGGLTVSGDAVGTLRYMGPERFRGWSDPRSDVYSLGATLYELIAFRPPFIDEERTEIIRRILYEDPAPLARLEPAVPRDLETIVLKALDKDLERRYAGARQLAEDLLRFVEGRPIAARRSGALERCWLWCGRNRRIAALMAISVLLLLALAAGGQYSARVTSLRLSRELEERARALRQTTLPGRRSESLRSLAEASRQRKDLSLRNEAAAAAVLFDAEPLRSFGDVRERVMGYTVDADTENLLWATGREDGTITIKRLDDGTELFSVKAESSSCDGVRFSPDGSLLAARHGGGRRLHVWDLASRRVVLMADGYGLGCDLASGNDSVVYAVGAREAVVRSLAGGSVIARAVLRDDITALCFDPKGERLAIGSYDGVRVLDLKTGSGREIPRAGGVLGLAWDPRGEVLGGGSTDQRLILWDVRSGRRLPYNFPYENQVATVAFSPDGAHVAASSWGSQTLVWDLRTGDNVLSLGGFVRRFSRDGSLLVSTFGDLEVRRVSRQAAYRVLRFESLERNEVVRRVAFHPGGRLLAAASWLGLHVWDAVTGDRLAGLSLPRLHSLDFDPAGDALYTAGDNGIHRWPVRITEEAGRAIVTVGPARRLATGSAGEAALSPDGRWIALVEDGPSRAVVIDALSGAARARTARHAAIRRSAWSPDSSLIATASASSGREGVVKLWNSRTGAEVASLVNGDATPVFSPDGTRLFAVNIWSGAPWRVGTWDRAPLPGDLSGLQHWSLQGFLAGGRLVIAQRVDGGARAFLSLHDAADGSEVISLRSPSPRAILSVAASPDGNVLAVGGGGSRVDLWDLRELRRELASVGLDWRGHELPPRRRASPEGPLELRVELGDLQERWIATEIQRADRAFREGEFGEAAVAYEEILKKAPSHVPALERLARLLLTAPPPFRDPGRAAALAVRRLRSVEIERARAAWSSWVGSARRQAAKLVGAEVLQKLRACVGEAWAFRKDGQPR